MLLFVAGVILMLAVYASVWLGAYKAQLSIRSSTHASMLQYGEAAQQLQDKHDLHRFGFAQLLRRRLGGISIFALSFNTMGLVGSAAIVFGPALGVGGPSVIGFGLPIKALLMLAVSSSIAELASAVPTAVFLWLITSSILACYTQQLQVLSFDIKRDIRNGCKAGHEDLKRSCLESKGRSL